MKKLLAPVTVRLEHDPLHVLCVVNAIDVAAQELFRTIEAQGKQVQLVRLIAEMDEQTYQNMEEVKRTSLIMPFMYNWNDWLVVFTTVVVEDTCRHFRLGYTHRE